jgi:hypothetical protein
MMIERKVEDIGKEQVQHIVDDDDDADVHANKDDYDVDDSTGIADHDQ